MDANRYHVACCVEWTQGWASLQYVPQGVDVWGGWEKIYSVAGDSTSLHKRSDIARTSLFRVLTLGIDFIVSNFAEVFLNIVLVTWSEIYKLKPVKSGVP